MTQAIALCDFEGVKEGDLSFQRHDVIKIINKAEDGWWEGIAEDGRQGLFPCNFVEVISSVRTLQTISFSNASLGSEAYSRERTLQSASEIIVSVKVVPILRSHKFLVEAAVSLRVLTAVKTTADFRNLEKVVRHLNPMMNGTLPPKWADNLYESLEAAERRATVLSSLLQLFVDETSDEVDLAIISWLDPQEEVEVCPETRKQVEQAQRAVAKKANSSDYLRSSMGIPELARVKKNYEAEDVIDLPLLKGSLVAVLSRRTFSTSWWTGETSDGTKGMFPAQSVRLLTRSEARTVVTRKKKTQKRQKRTISFSKLSLFSKSGAENKSEFNCRKERWQVTYDNFILPDLNSFEELLLNGFVVLFNNDLVSGELDSNSLQDGDKVTLSYRAYLWGFRKPRLIKFAASDLPNVHNYIGPLEFSIGKGEVVKGLEEAVRTLQTGKEYRIIVTPEFGYGSLGCPPSVPPDSHLVYDVKLENIQRVASHSLPLAQPFPTSPLTFRRKHTGSHKISLFESWKSSKLSLLFSLDPNADERRANTSSLVDVTDTKAFETPAFGSRDRTTQSQKNAAEEDKKSCKPHERYSLGKMQQIVDNRAYSQHEVDPSFIEDYLTEEAFHEAFRCNRMSFVIFPESKQKKLKKDVGLC